MKSKNVWITIRGVMPFDDNGAIEIYTDGRLSGIPGGFLLTYTECESLGMGQTHTSLVISDKQVTLMRDGDVSTQMIFEPCKRHMSYYETDAGGIAVGINTDRLQTNFTENGGRVEISYNIDLDNAAIGAASISIDVSENYTRQANRWPLSEPVDDKFYH